jgi:hypothetical protein
VDERSKTITDGFSKFSKTKAKFQLSKKQLNTLSSANITAGGSLYKMGRSGYGSVKVLRRT